MHQRSADLMSSGFYRQTADLLITCPCDYTGWVPAVEDWERYSITWTCPSCGAENEEDNSREDA